MEMQDVYTDVILPYFTLWLHAQSGLRFLLMKSGVSKLWGYPSSL